MKLSSDDPRLTAYALGELDVAERAAIEAALADSPEARAAVEEIRAAAKRLTSELTAEPCPELAPAQRAALESRTAAAKVVPFPSQRVWRTIGIAAAAACLLALAGWAVFGPTLDRRQAKGGSEHSNKPLTQNPQSTTQPNEPKVVAGNAVTATNTVTNSVLQARSATLIVKGMALFGMREFSLAEAQFAEALQLDPSNTNAEHYAKLCKEAITRQQQANKAQTPQLPSRALSRARQNLNQKLDSIRLPEIRYDSLPLAQVFESLRQQAKAADPEKRGVNIIVSTAADPGVGDPGVDMTAVTIHVDRALRDVTLRQALDSIVKGASEPIKYSVEDWGVLLSSASTSSVVVMAPVLYPSTGLPVSGTGVANSDLRARSATLAQDGKLFFEAGNLSLAEANLAEALRLDPSNVGAEYYAKLTKHAIALDQKETSGVYSVNVVGLDFGGLQPDLKVQSRWSSGGVGGGSRAPSQGQSPNVPQIASSTPGYRFNTRTSERARYAQRLQQRVWKADGAPADSANIPTPITAYAPFIENAFVPVLQEPLSTFSIDVDTASYANVRRFLSSGQLPPRDAVRIEELVNYFSYVYPAPQGDDPFSASIETAGCPWAPEHRLVRVALRGRELPRGKRPPSNFVFLIDVSGSMQPPERLPLLKQALRALVKKMGEGDRVAIVVYASEAGVKLESTSCTEKEKILAVIDALEAGGSTNGGEGIQQAYTMARKNFIQGGVNRVLLCTDGDFNVGLTDQNALVALVKENAATGVFLTTLGVGTDNYKDALMQRLADRANGNYHYLDTLEEANKVLIEQMNANLVTIAKDVKIQVEFNPAQISAYRLIGYEKRMLRAPDFNNDRKDAGEIGAGHTVTAFYEIVPAGKAAVQPVVDKLKYQSAVAPASYSEKGEQSKELLTLKLRYKQPDGETSKLIEFPHTDGGSSYGKASADFKFAASVASFGMLLRGSEHKGGATFDTVLELAEEGKGADDGGWRAEFINLVKKAKKLQE